MTTSEQLERETEQARARVEGTLDELRQRITPGQILDEAFGYAASGNAAAFFRNLGSKAVDNPMPVALLGAGLVWLMATNGSSAGRTPALAHDNGHGHGASWSKPLDDAGNRIGDAVGQVGDAARTAAGGVLGAVRSTAGSVADTARSAASAVGDAARGIGDAADRTTAYVGDRASSTYHSASTGIRKVAAMAGNTASGLGQDAARTTRGIVDFVTPQPLVLAGLGMAIGAAIGAAFKTTEMEDRLVGEAADEVKQKVSDLASGPVEAVKSALGNKPEGGQAEADDDPADAEMSEDAFDHPRNPGPARTGGLGSA